MAGTVAAVMWCWAAFGNGHGFRCRPVRIEVKMERPEFSVWVFLADGRHMPVVRFTNAESAVLTAKLATSTAPICDFAERIIITDGGDHTCFEWVRGKGVTFPLEAKGRH